MCVGECGRVWDNRSCLIVVVSFVVHLPRSSKIVSAIASNIWGIYESNKDMVHGSDGQMLLLDCEVDGGLRELFLSNCTSVVCVCVCVCVCVWLSLYVCVHTLLSSHALSLSPLTDSMQFILILDFVCDPVMN